MEPALASTATAPIAATSRATTAIARPWRGRPVFGGVVAGGLDLSGGGPGLALGGAPPERETIAGVTRRGAVPAVAGPAATGIASGVVRAVG